MAKAKITWIKSTICCIDSHHRTIEALGLKRLGHSVTKELTPQIKGMLRNVEFLVKVEPVNQ